ncbi:MAG: DNA mismatch repair endonuclease MutL [Candidatus Buchananbacteria bacterium]|nr:DNA mismatch repair endonuclease MutL [Candidatus Buchananbacteria bacterium]
MIKKLDKDLINKIAAGEVVERPASVVKELMENSIDAQADQIILEIKTGGIDLIALQDNGLGMTPKDAQLAIESHATSKISSIDDLFNIQTLGFRGEALASISAVSQFSLETKRQDSNEGTKLQMINNKLKIESYGCPDGTKIIIKELFHNVPARKKFLKSANTEYNHILEIFTNFALINPQISFKLTHNNKLILNLPSSKDWLARIKQVLGTDIADNLIPLNTKGSINLTGYLGKPQIARNNRKSQFIFINNRAVTDFIIAKAVKEGYGSLISRELYPTFILNINLPPALVDVNVHPRKAEVKFKAPQEIYLAVLKETQKLLTNNISQQIKINSETPVKKFTLKPQRNSKYFRPSVSYQPPFKNIKSQPSQISQAIKFSQELLKDGFIDQSTIEKIGDWRLLGQIHKAYLLVEAPQGVLIIDQHAAAERILYEKFKNDYASQKIKSQKLLLPLTLELSSREVAVINQSLEFLQNLGFDIEIFGNNSFIINAVPQDLDKLDVKITILGLINDLEENDFKKIKSIDDQKDLVIKYTACRTAIKFNDKIDIKEQIKLLEDIRQIIDKINTCPHGRPFIMELTLDQLAKNFKRI